MPGETAMTPTPKPGRETVVEEVRETVHEANEARNNFVNLYSRGIDRIADIQKRSIDIAVQQNAEMIDTWKKLVQKLPGGARLPLLDVTATMFERFADAQKHAIDLAVEQSRSVIESVKDRATVANKATEAAIHVTNQAVERSVAAQKKVVETTVAQTKAVLEATRQQMGAAGMPADTAVSSFQRGVDSFVEAQKEMLDLVAH
jgi:chorismate mutase